MKRSSSPSTAPGTSTPSAPAARSRSDSRARFACRAGVLALALSAEACSPGRVPAHPVPPPQPAAQALSPLHATRGSGAAIVDAEGRQVLLRGINVNQLGDYYADSPNLRTVEPLTELDFSQIAALGFDAVRLVVNWSSLQPRRGSVDLAEIERLHQAVRWAAAHRLYVIIDLHQDAWGKFIASPPGTTCPAGLDPAIGWDGAPQWATITDGQSTCRGAERELSPAVATAWVNFYKDAGGIQSELINTWRTIGASFASDTNVAGYDLMNEPHPGLSIGGEELPSLSQYYQRALASIRAGEKAIPNSFSHLVFFEPMVTWFLLGSAAAPPAFSTDPDLVFAPHLYTGSLSEGVHLTDHQMTTIADGFTEAVKESAAYGTPWWSGEWGWFDAPAADAASVREYGRLEDATSVGGAWWDWKQSCGDPHQIGSPGAAPRPISDGLVRSSCPAQETLGTPGEFTRILSRPYPRAAAGKLTSVSVDLPTGTTDILGATVTAGTVDVWDPGRARPVVTGAGKVSAHVLDGGWTVTADVGVGLYHLHLSH